MDVKMYIWRSEHGYWFVITENPDNHFMYMNPITDRAADGLRVRGVPIKEFG